VGNDRDTLLKIQSIWWTAWGKQKLQGLSTSRPITRIFFTNDSVGYTPGYITGDSGRTWKVQDNTINRFPHLATDIWFTNDSTGFIAGYDYWGNIYKTTNKGNDWKQVKIPSFIWELYSIHFPNPNIGYATGLQRVDGKYKDVIIKTIDNGNTWDTVATIPSLINIKLSSIRCTEMNTCYAVGNRGTIIKTTDGGKSWKFQSSGTIQNLNKIFFTDAQTGHIVGDSGVILKTINGGDIAGISDPVSKSLSVKIYPNPFKTNTTIFIEGIPPANAIFKLTDITGREILQSPIKDQNTLIEREQLPAGLYFYTINSTKGLLKSGKLIAE